MPKKRGEIFARADEDGAGRVTIGVHPGFLAELEPANAELRGALELP